MRIQLQNDANVALDVRLEMQREEPPSRIIAIHVQYDGVTLPVTQRQFATICIHNNYTI